MYACMYVGIYAGLCVRWSKDTVTVTVTIMYMNTAIVLRSSVDAYAHMHACLHMRTCANMCMCVSIVFMHVEERTKERLAGSMYPNTSFV